MLRTIFAYIVQGATFVFYAWLTWLLINILISVFIDLRNKLFTRNRAE